jgi:hypothetical protein
LNDGGGALALKPPSGEGPLDLGWPIALEERLPTPGVALGPISLPATTRRLSVFGSANIGVTVRHLPSLPHIMLPNGSTVGEWTRPQLDAAYAANTMPALLPGAQ